jgi:DNA-directed RNA polymerase beta subunit
MLKTYINSTIARPLLDAYEHALKNMSFEDINLKEIHNNACDSDRLKKNNIRLITGGSKKMIKTGTRGRAIVNRLNSQQYKGGFLDRISSLRQIVSDPTTATSKKSEREHQMRQLHRTNFGYKCPIQTQESENIGRNKQMAITCNISTPSNISVLLETLEAEYKTGLIIKSPSQDQKPILTRVTINWTGIELGWTDQPDILSAKYRHARSIGQIDKTISIVWNIQLAMVSFYCDGDRLIRPLIPVRNNYGDAWTSQLCKNAGDLSDFVQWSALRADDIASLRLGSVTISDLISTGKIEMIDAEEQWFETIIAYSPEHLIANAKNHLIRYTHVEMPAAIYGLPALVSNGFNLDHGVRTAYASMQAKQAAAEHASNWRHRKDKGISLQTYNEISPVYTIANTMTIAAGVVCRIAVMCNPYNQEDSQAHNAMIIQSGKLTTEYLEKYSASLGNGEEFHIPSIANSKRKIFADFSAINAATCFPELGTLLQKGSVIIPKVHKTHNKETGETIYEDRSVIYTSIEPAIVYKCVEFRNEDDINTREVYTMKTRNPVIGDKFSSRHGQKGVCGFVYQPNNMAFESDGATPDIIINPHCMPTRLTTAQWVESVLALVYAGLCKSIDGTVHSSINMREIPEMLKSLGFHPDGTAQMFDPTTGMAIKTRIFSGMVLYQNLQKNVRDKRYVIESGPTDIITRGPLEGKSVEGGLRLGEMERDVLLAIGATLFISEKYYWHSNQATIYVCENCGTVPRVNTKFGVDCQLCGDGAQVYAIDTTWASWVFLEELRTLNIKIRFELEEHIYYK